MFCPKLMVQGFGGDDDHTQEAEELAARLGKQGCAASLRLISGVGHFMTLTSPNM